MLYEKIIKPYLFQKDAEDAHHLAIHMMRRIGNRKSGRRLLSALFKNTSDPRLEQRLWNLHFPNPVGLAAGLDKNGEAIHGFSSIGFGFIEIGTLTPKPQPGNELPRLFRLPTDEALINRMGFNNRGARETADELAATDPTPIPLGINIGKNKTTPNEKAVEDYRACIRELYAYGDFFVINISSPNTPGLRELQFGEGLKALLAGIFAEIKVQMMEKNAKEKPVLVKIAPDMNTDALEEIIDTVRKTKVAGLIATNTTVDRDGLHHPHKEQQGGLSGRPLKEKSTETIRRIYQMTKGDLPIIGVGGIFSGRDAYEKICAGASLIQIYTGLIYRGPDLIKSINRELISLLERDGFASLSQAVGCKSK